MPLSVVQDPNGKNTGQATWTYSIADGAFDFLAAGETLTLTYMARVDNNYAPNNETTFVPFTVVITGTNDKPTLSATGGTITERIGTGNTAVDTVTGTVTFADVDLTDRPVVSAAISTTDPFRYYDAEGNDITATLTPAQLAAIKAVEVPLSVVQAAGNTHNGSASWTYSIEDSKFDFIAKGETLTLNYVAQVDDGHGGVVSTPITVSIKGADVVVTGTNDVPTIATTSAAFAEFSNLNQPNPTGSTALHTASGTISFTDVDLTDRPVASAAFTAFSYLNAYSVDVTSQLTAKQLAAISAVDEPLTVVQSPGNTNDGSASWSYSTADGAFDFLAYGEILTLAYTATVDDGHGGVVTKPITVTVTGSNDTAEITSDLQTAAIAERAGIHGSATPDTASGAITFVDADLTDTHAVKITGVNASGVMTALANGTVQLSWLSLGPLADSTDGVQGSKGWSFSAPDSYFDYLADGEMVTLAYTVEVDDHHGGVTSQDIVVTVNGSNDAPDDRRHRAAGPRRADRYRAADDDDISCLHRPRSVGCRPHRHRHRRSGDRHHHGSSARSDCADRAGDARRGDKSRRFLGRLRQPVVLGGIDRVRLSGEGRSPDADLHGCDRRWRWRRNAEDFCRHRHRHRRRACYCQHRAAEPDRAGRHLGADHDDPGHLHRRRPDRYWPRR